MDWEFGAGRCKRPHLEWINSKVLLYSRASLVAQLVKHPPAMWATRDICLGQEEPLEKGQATHFSILAWRIPWGHKELDTTERLSLSLYNTGV